MALGSEEDAMLIEWLIFGAIVFMGWALDHDMGKARSTLIALQQDVAAIRDALESK